MTNKTMMGGPISLRLWQRRRDWGGDRYRERFSGGFGGDGGGDDDIALGMRTMKSNRNMKCITNIFI